jgi:hypothetical protein
MICGGKRIALSRVLTLVRSIQMKGAAAQRQMRIRMRWTRG